ncbi:PREDICTED: UBX domain-containing protein 6-like [Priapulus caudatus]|uniref:UBX domain-containing protein 6-like n=1 Tax=Priapulus caudatus TaxID=37621 RepID=A0ABM1F0R9_PRICU|nr:PREDICTED: UBX domain-containing protein 6-like [Priapulus caudatus]XP_014678040.1 PREDICTED: UBX domain-containing protein 6-like [Priapulus caudatus]
MAAIRKFFKGKTMDIKFKKAGEGHKLTDVPPPPKQSSAQKGAGPSRQCSQEATAAKKAAADAALARLQAPAPGFAKGGSTAIQIRVRKELEAERKLAKAEAEKAAMAAGKAAPRTADLDGPPMLSVSGVYYRCPLVGPEVGPREAIEARIREFLYAQAEEEPTIGHALILLTLNRQRARVAVETICRYLDNIIAEPGNERYRKVRVGNRAFCERVAGLEGAAAYLRAVGFDEQTLPFEDGEADFLVMSGEVAADTGRLVEAREALLAAEPILPELDRGLQVFSPSSNVTKFDLPDEFFNLTVEEVKREAKQRSDDMEKQLQLRTKAMREREEQKELRKYHFTLLRVRLPDGVILQGTFRCTERAAAVYGFVRDNLLNDWQPFCLTPSGGRALAEEDEATLAELGLAPAAVLSFAWDQEVLQEVIAQQGGPDRVEHLKPELLSLMQML